MTGTILWQWVQLHHFLLTGILGALLIMLLIGIGLDAWVKTLRAGCRSRARGEQPPMHAVGSPEHHAQIVAAIHQVNERLEPQGKRVPERVAMEIIKQLEESVSTQSAYGSTLQSDETAQ